MSVWYLELDDEITDAVARLRAAKDERVVFVVPPGSRIGTGRINFRLLAREAETRGLGLALVSGDAQVRALAASAGLPVFATVSESEAAEASGTLLAGVAATSAVVGATSLTAGSTSSTAPGPLPGSGGATALPDPRWVTDGSEQKAAARRPRRVSRRVGMTVGGLALVTAIGGGGLYAAYVLIPTATITLVQQAHELEPATLAIQVKEGATTDPATGVVGGVRLAIPVTVQGTVTATGTGTPITARASGTVTFANHSPNPILIGDQTVVGTTTGITFETQDVITVPAGGSMDVAIKAVDAGLVGNVDAGTITQMPDELRVRWLSNGTVTNKEPTTGGKSIPQKLVTKDDYDRALAELNTRLQTELARQAATPTGIPADGIVYLATLLPGDVTTTPPQDQVVGQPVATTNIMASMTGSVLTSSAGAITDAATQMLQAKAPDTQFVPDSIQVTTGDPVIGDDGTVAYQATVSGRAFDRQVKEQALKDLVKGRTVSDAQGILKEYGSATITLSPDFMPTLPDDPNRIVVHLTPLGSSPP